MGLEQVMRLALERGFFFPSAEIYPSAPAGFWDYGHLGVLMRERYVEAWLREVVRRDEMILLDGSQILPRDVFIASGHLESFADPVSTCIRCGSIYRVDRLVEEKAGIKVPERAPPREIDEVLRRSGVACPACGGELGEVSLFNMMFGLSVGAGREEAYLRPETCQNIFIDFPRIYKTSRRKLPLALAQIGKSFRNEVSPRQSLARLREFYQAEVEVFFNPRRANEYEKATRVADYELRLFFDDKLEVLTCREGVESGVLSSWLVAYYLALIQNFYLKLRIPSERIRLRRLLEDEKAFYAREAWDLEVSTSIGWLELVACNNRGDYDLSRHARVSGADMTVYEDGERFIPHVFELSMGIDRSILALLDMGYTEEGGRALLRLAPALAPYHAAVFPLVSRDELVSVAREIYNSLIEDFDVFYDESGSIGRRYRRQDEVGTPFCITVDYDTLKDGTVTVRDRDTMKQERVRKEELSMYLRGRLRL